MSACLYANACISAANTTRFRWGPLLLASWPDIKAIRLVNKGGMLNVDQLLLIDYLSEYNPKYF